MSDPELACTDEHCITCGDVAVEVRRRGDRDLGARPGDPAVTEGVDAHHRTVDLEVVELLGIDGPDDPGVPDPDQVVDHR